MTCPPDAADVLSALLIPDSRIGSATLQAIGAGSTESDYSTAGARPGVPTPVVGSLLGLLASGTQDDGGSIGLLTGREGMPGRDGAGFLYRDLAAGDTASQYRGADGGQAITGSYPLDMVSTATVVQAHPVAIRLQSGKLLVLHNQNSTTQHINVALFDPATDAWSTTSFAASSATYDQTGPGLCQLPNGDVLAAIQAPDGAQVDIWRSQDDGATWALAAARVLQTALATGAAVTGLSLCYAGGLLGLYIAYTKTGPTLTAAAYYSTDLGATFRQSLADWNTTTSGDQVRRLVAVGLTGGGVLLVCERTSGPAIEYRQIASPLQAPTDAGATDLATTAGTAKSAALTAWEDEIGVLFVMAAVTGSNASDCTAFRSDDGGSTWAEYDSPAVRGSGTTAYLRHYDAVDVGGRVALVSRFTSTSSYTGRSVLVLWLGGYARVTVPATSTTDNFRSEDYIGWAPANVNDPGPYVPIDEPHNMGFPATGGADTDDSLTADGRLEYATTAAQRYHSINPTSYSQGDEAAIAYFDVEVTSGGDKTAKEVGIEVGEASATQGHRISIRLDTTGAECWDEVAGAQIGSTLSIDMTEPLVFLAIVGKDPNTTGAAKVWYWRRGHVREAVLWIDEDALSNYGAVGDAQYMAWGHLGSTTATSKWRLVAWTHDNIGKFSPRSEEPACAEWIALDGRDLRSRPFSSRPRYVVGGLKVTAQGGPAYRGDAWQIDADSAYAIRHIFPGESSSPRDEWRSDGDGVDMAIVFDLESTYAADTRPLGSSLAMLLRNTNLGAAKLQRWDGAAWTDIMAPASYTDWTGLDYAREGRVLRVDTGTTQTATRWLNHNDHAGDIVEDTGNAWLATIQTNRGGAWTSSAAKRPRILLDSEGLSGGDPTSGTMRIRRRDFGGVAHEQDDDARFWRIFIPAQSTPEGYYRIGQVVIGDLVVLGHPPDEGQRRELRFAVETETSRGGRRSAVSEGPARRVAIFGWQDGAVDSAQSQHDDPAPTTGLIRGSTGGEVIATPWDTTTSVRGVLERLDGPRQLVAFLPAVGKGTGTLALTRRTWVVGRITTGWVRSGVLGVPTWSEADRIEVLRVEEEV